MKNINFAQLKFVIKAEEEIELPEYKGSTFRGAFGNSFRKLTCILKTQHCQECLLKEKCIYRYIFETPLPKDSTILRNFENIPHPFIIVPPLEDNRVYCRGENLEFNVTLIGKAIEYLPYFALSFHMMGEQGIGKNRSRYKLENIIDSEGKQIYSNEKNELSGSYKTNTIDDFEARINELSSAKEVKIEFITPFRVKYNGKYTDSIEFHVIIRNLLRRLANLALFHCNTKLDIDFKALIEKSESIKIKSKNTFWHEWERYSARQDTRMSLGGVKGSITFDGDFSEFAPYLVLGEHLHIGKNTSFGLGKYIINGV